MLFRIVFILFLYFLPSLSSHAGYLGGGHLFTTTSTFDDQEEGFRLDVGTSINSFLDLEWGYVEFGGGGFDRPDYKEPDTTSDFDTSDDRESFENFEFGSVTSDDGGLKFSGIEELNANGISAGMKFKLKASDWTTLYLRTSFLAWKATTTVIEMYGEREPQDINNNTVAPEIAVNLNPCGSLGGPGQRCEITSEGKTHWAVDFWYGYGALIKPYDWMAIRAEYSIVTLNAVAFPKSVLEGFSTSLEIHF